MFRIEALTLFISLPLLPVPNFSLLLLFLHFLPLYTFLPTPIYLTSYPYISKFLRYPSTSLLYHRLRLSRFRPFLQFLPLPSLFLAPIPLFRFLIPQFMYYIHCVSYSPLPRTFTCFNSRVLNKNPLLRTSIHVFIVLEHNMDKTKLGIYLPGLKINESEFRVVDIVNLHAFFYSIPIV